MEINTKKVDGRRTVQYTTYDELLADAQRISQEQRLSQKQVQTLGNWSVGQIFEHLARSLDASIDGSDFSLPAPMRWIFTLFMKRKFLKGSIPSGFSAPDSMIPDEISVEEGLAILQEAITRQKEEPNRAIHPAFGKISREEWEDFNLRHSEMHMSFIITD